MVTIKSTTQAERASNLVELETLKTGETVNFKDLEKFVQENNDGVKLSRSTWHAIQDPDYHYKRTDVLEAVARYFGAPEGFLIFEDAVASEEYQERVAELNRSRADALVEQMSKLARRCSDSELFNNVMARTLERAAVERGLSIDSAKRLVVGN